MFAYARLHPRYYPWNWPRPWIPIVAFVNVEVVGSHNVLFPLPAPLHGFKAAVIVALHAGQPLVGVEALHVGPHAVVELGGELVIVILVVRDELDCGSVKHIRMIDAF